MNEANTKQPGSVNICAQFCDAFIHSKHARLAFIFVCACVTLCAQARTFSGQEFYGSACKITL
jgi:hypothetical protein